MTSRAVLPVFRTVMTAVALLAASAFTVRADPMVDFSDTFTPTASPLWNNYSGNWTTSGGRYFAQEPNNDPLAVTGLPFDLADFTLSVTVNNLGDGGLLLRGDGTNQNGVLLVIGGSGYGQGIRGFYSAGHNMYWHVLHNGTCDGSPTTDCPLLNAANNVVEPGSTHTIRVVVSGFTYAAYIDASTTPATTFFDTTFSNGRVGLYDDQPNTTTGSGFGPPQTFSNFRLQELAPGPPPTVTPEPTSAGLLCVGAGILFSFRRWRQTRSASDQGVLRRSV